MTTEQQELDGFVFVREIPDGTRYYQSGNSMVLVSAGQTLDGVLSQLASNNTAELNGALVDMINATQYQNSRQNEYPPITDYIDGVVKGDQAQIDAYIAACQAVKAKYPKPE